MRRLLLRLPANQRAACWDAYRREGAFPDREHAADLEVLSRLGAVEKVEGQPGTMWSLSQAAREAISGSRQLSGKLEASLAERDRLRDERARERAVERAAGYIGELGFAERRELAVLIDRGQIVCDGDVRDALIDRFGHALVEVDEVSPSEIEVRPTDAAVEADRREPSLLARAREYGALRDGGSDE